MKTQNRNRVQDDPTRSFIAGSSATALALRNRICALASGLLALAILAGCASTKVTNQQSYMAVGEKLPRPDRILIYDFGASLADIPKDSALVSQASAPATSPTDQQTALGRQLGVQIAADLTADIRKMGLPAVQVSKGATPQLNDIVIRGYLVSVEEGTTAKRMVIGFGSGGSQLTTFIEGYHMTANGLRKLGSGTVGASGSKGPGMAVGAATWAITGSPVGLIVGGGLKVYGEASGRSQIEGRAKATAKEIADVLKTRFQKQGWID